MASGPGSGGRDVGSQDAYQARVSLADHRSPVAGHRSPVTGDRRQVTGQPGRCQLAGSFSSSTSATFLPWSQMPPKRAEPSITMIPIPPPA